MPKFILLLTILAFSFRISAQDIADLEAFEKAMKPGTQITYDVATKEKQYKLTITLKKLGDEMTFDWKTTENKSGTVSVNSNAMAKADALFSTFNGGDSKLDKETAFWLSKKIVNDVNSTTQASIKLKGGADTATVMSNATTSLGFSLDGNFVNLSAWELQGGDPKYTVDVLESAKFPLIYKLDIGYTITLSEIKSQ